MFDSVCIDTKGDLEMKESTIREKPQTNLSIHSQVVDFSPIIS